MGGDSLSWPNKEQKSENGRRRKGTSLLNILEKGGYDRREGGGLKAENENEVFQLRRRERKPF